MRVGGRWVCEEEGEAEWKSSCVRCWNRGHAISGSEEPSVQRWDKGVEPGVSGGRVGCCCCEGEGEVLVEEEEEEVDWACPRDWVTWRVSRMGLARWMARRRLAV